jgi:hypothetical protein
VAPAGRTGERRPVAGGQCVSRSPRRRAVLLALAWLLATGAHWDVIQVAAWGRMWMTLAQVQPPGRALAAVFSPEAMCGICITVRTAKHDQAEHPVLALSAAKLPLLLPAPRTIVVAAPAASAAQGATDLPWCGIGRGAPPVPPPRTGMRPA